MYRSIQINFINTFLITLLSSLIFSFGGCIKENSSNSQVTPACDPNITDFSNDWLYNQTWIADTANSYRFIHHYTRELNDIYRYKSPSNEIIYIFWAYSMPIISNIYEIKDCDGVTIETLTNSTSAQLTTYMTTNYDPNFDISSDLIYIAS